MQDKLSVLTVIQAHIAKLKDYLLRQVFATEDISALERVPLQLRQTQRLEEYAQRDNIVLLVQRLQEIAHLVHIVVPHS